MEALPEGKYSPTRTGYARLTLIVSKTGARRWEHAYRFPSGRKGGANRTKGFSFDLPIDTIRRQLDELRDQINAGIDPNGKTSATHSSLEGTALFRDVARECYGTRDTKHLRTVFQPMEKDAFPVFGAKAIRDVTFQDVKTALDRPWLRGAKEKTSRLRGCLDVVFAYAISKQWCERNYPREMAPAYPRPNTQNEYKPLPLRMLPAFLRGLSTHGERGGIAVQLAFELMVLTGSRPGNVFAAEWSEFDGLDGPSPMWTILGDKMKAGQRHMVPLSRQAADVMRQMRAYAYGAMGGLGRYVFPRQFSGPEDGDSHISNGAFAVVIESLGFRGIVHPHGFRKVFSTLCHSNRDFRPDDIERCIAHSKGSKVSRTYNHHGYIDEHREIAQWYADKLDQLRASSTLDGILPYEMLREDEIRIKERKDWDTYMRVANAIRVSIPGVTEGG